MRAVAIVKGASSSIGAVGGKCEIQLIKAAVSSALEPPFLFTLSENLAAIFKPESSSTATIVQSSALARILSGINAPFTECAV